MYASRVKITQGQMLENVGMNAQTPPEAQICLRDLQGHWSRSLRVKCLKTLGIDSQSKLGYVNVMVKVEGKVQG